MKENKITVKEQGKIIGKVRAISLKKGSVEQVGNSFVYNKEDIIRDTGFKHNLIMFGTNTGKSLILQRILILVKLSIDK